MLMECMSVFLVYSKITKLTVYPKPVITKKLYIFIKFLNCQIINLQMFSDEGGIDLRKIKKMCSFI